MPFELFKWHEWGLIFCSPFQLTHLGQTNSKLNDMPRLLANAISSASLAEVLSGAKLCLTLSRPLVTGSVTDNSRTSLYQGCPSQLRVIRIISTSSTLTFNRTSPIIEKMWKAYSNSVGMYLLLGCVDLLPTAGKMVSYLMAWSWYKKFQLWKFPSYTNFLE